MIETTIAATENTDTSNEALSYVIGLFTLGFGMFFDAIYDFLHLIGIDTGFEIVDK